ncbi:hypothetical protein BSL78_04779 [Apostichopus japonicus]|uniref:Uncharacterized protein n=1 Tax=Stichopus japonicus TaxID=307972 RepID=A0A2G8LDE1_STIJA|nr:hypothetical protein BSL78_04779 [Apostichopus japonicus]
MDESNLSQSGDADVSIAADPTVCECRTTCQRKSGKSACPCRMYDLFCSESCKCGTRTRHCANREPLDSSDSEDDEHNERFAEGMPEQLEDTIEEKIKNFVHELEREDLENVATDLLKRNPGAYEDYLLKENSYFKRKVTIHLRAQDGVPVAGVKKCLKMWRKNAAGCRKVVCLRVGFS